ncbi:DUF6249 domain-containing protein [Algoriphagus confluentis]|uniref:DUF6249 domain-containing protein n=1 Tax=Algoriphagus confluentis TaxID=1697556 RepID=A0ABQ6PU59_9BACT|nr:hypothetical protein Aconfl_41510 [Algoriphagus confluentis]
MKKLITSLLIAAATVRGISKCQAMSATASNEVPATTTNGSLGEIILPILFIVFLVFMLVSMIRYFLDYRLKNKLIERGMAEQLSAYLLEKNDREKQNEAIKLAILFSGLGVGLTTVYFTAPLDIHSLAVMAISLGLSYLAYFLYLRR